MADVVVERGAVSADEFLALLESSGLAKWRAIDDRARLEAALAAPALVVTARRDGELVGIARSLTDFAWACYVADLAVAAGEQGTGLGNRLLEATRHELRPGCLFTLLSAPEAVGFYERVGMQRHPAAFVLRDR